jgi:hypothetical protein
MIRRILKLLVALPVLLGIWGYANSAGITAEMSKMTGINIPAPFTLPAPLAKALGIKEEVQTKVKEEARKQALALVKREVARRYGPQAAAAVPNDLSLEQLKTFDYAKFKTILDATKGDRTKIAQQLGVKVPGLPPVPTIPKPGSGTPSGEVPWMNQGAYRDALKALPTLPIKGKAPKTGYSRDQFGPAWSDSAGSSIWTRNGCSTRDDALKRDLVNETFKPGTNNCDVTKGTLPYDPYSGQKNRPFDQSKGSSGDYALDAEHVVALGSAWVTGAQQWPEAKRAAFANDPLVLTMVNPGDNRAKGDADFATWLPPNKAYRCGYASRQIAIKRTYGLWITQAEHDAMVTVLKGCV